MLELASAHDQMSSSSYSFIYQLMEIERDKERKIFVLNGIVVNGLALEAERSGVHIPTMPYWIATLGKLFTDISSQVFSAPRNLG